jgi:hypothetical protein
MKVSLVLIQLFSFNLRSVGKPKILFGITGAPIGFLEEAIEIVEKLNRDAQVRYHIIRSMKSNTVEQVRVVMGNQAAKTIQAKLPEEIKHYTDDDEVNSYQNKGDQGLHTEVNQILAHSDNQISAENMGRYVSRLSTLCSFFGPSVPWSL